MRLPHLAQSILWCVPLALQTAIAAVMALRGLIRVFPVFFVYTVLVPARDVILFLLELFRSTKNQYSNQYALVFWWGDAILILLSLGVVVETLRHLFQPYPFLRFVFKIVWIVAVLSSVFAVFLFQANSPSGTDRLLESIILMERSARILQVCLLIVLISLMSRLGLTWQHYSLGIAAGFGIYSALDLTLLQFRTRLHSLSDDNFALLGSAAYNLAVVTWAFCFLKPQGETPVDSLPSTDMENWNDALREQVKKWYRR